jgi:hypothetical protein
MNTRQRRERRAEGWAAIMRDRRPEENVFFGRNPDVGACRFPRDSRHLSGVAPRPLVLRDETSTAYSVAA